MLIFIEYSFNGEIGKICYDIDNYSLAESKILIPEWLKQDNIESESWHIYQVLESLMTETE
jgi:hypothetical protein